MARINSRGAAAFSAVALCLWLAGCKHAPQVTSSQGSASDIVQTVEAAGSGSLGAATDESLRVWFSQHLDVAAKIQPSCGVRAKTADASWQTTPEGKACVSAAVVIETSGYGKHKVAIPPQFVGKGGIYGNKPERSSK